MRKGVLKDSEGESVVGSIVWVRRRNGSWWPGKILGPAELSAANIVSPRSGTPVKLLGREDASVTSSKLLGQEDACDDAFGSACFFNCQKHILDNKVFRSSTSVKLLARENASVDWYNLEKSKRVKPFRCGEFNECIERAESALGVPPKKREKYARREDAILHALELEKQLRGDKLGNLGSPADGYSTKPSGTLGKELMISSECSNYGNGNDINFKPNSGKHFVHTDKDRYDTICPREPEGANQIREDMDASKLLPLINGNDAILSIRGSLENKRKLPNDVLTNKSLEKRCDRRSTPVHVLQKSVKFPSGSFQLSRKEHIEPMSHTEMTSLYIPIESNNCPREDELVSPIPLAKSPSLVEVENFPFPTALDEQCASESTESTKTDSSKTLSMESEKDDEIASLAEPAFIPELEPVSLQIQYGSMSHGLPDNNLSHLYPQDHVPASLGVSQWKTKGKRKNRSLTRRSTEATDRWVARGSMYTANLEDVGRDRFGETDIIERNFTTQRRPNCNQKYTSNSNAPFKGFDDVSLKVINWDDLASKKQPLLRGYGGDIRNHVGPMFSNHGYGERIKSGLIDVDLKVQSSYKREHVPLISLRSKLNGKAIVGHSIQVEILEEATDSHHSSTGDIGLEFSEYDAAIPAVRRTARRSTNFRIPHSQQLTTINGKDNTQYFPDVNHNMKAPFRGSGVGKFNHRSSVLRKDLNRHFSKEPQKETLSSDQGISDLCTINREPIFGNSSRSGNSNSFRGGGLMKSEPGPTTVACIPVKLVYSRLNEGLVGRRH